MSGCRRAISIATRVGEGASLDERERQHVSECRHCRSAIQRAEAFPTLLRTAARSLVAEAALAIPSPATAAATMPVGWHAAVVIDRRAFEPLARRSVPWAAAGRIAGLAGTAAAIVAVVVLAAPRLVGPAAPAPRTAEAIVGQLVALQYACSAEPLPSPAAGSGPAFDCVGASPILAGVRITIHATVGGSLSSLVAELPGSQTPENRASVEALVGQLAATPFADSASANATADWVDRFFTPASDPGVTSLRRGGFVLRLSVIPARPYELDVYPELPR